MKSTFSIALILSASMSQAMLPPAYNNLRKLDEVVATLAKGGSGLTVKQPADVTLNSLKLEVPAALNMAPYSEFATVDLGNLVCIVKLTMVAKPAGMIGATDYQGELTRPCSHYETFAPVVVMKYVDIRKELDVLAVQGQMVRAFKVELAAQGPRVVVTP